MTKSIANGQFVGVIKGGDPTKEEFMIDEETGETEPTFEYQPMKANGKNDGKEWLVIAEQTDEIRLLRDAFERSKNSNAIDKVKANTSLLESSMHYKKRPMKRDGNKILAYTAARI